MLKEIAKIWAPVFDNPWLCYVIDQYVDWCLRMYYFPVQAALDIQELHDLVRASNICQPQKFKTSDVEPT